jgi:preprotein translocase subunit SecD
MRILVLLAALLLTACDRLMGPPPEGPGAMIVLEVDKEQLRARELRKLSQPIREQLRQAPRIAQASLDGRRVEGDHLIIKLANPADVPAATERITRIGDVGVTAPGSDTIEVRLSDKRMSEAVGLAARASVGTVRRRLSLAGLPNVKVVEHGQITALIPGVMEPKDMASLLRMLTFSGDLSLNLVDLQATIDAERDPTLWPIGEEHNNRMALPDDSRGGIPVVISMDAIVRGEDVASASQSYDQSNQPSIIFQLKEAGKKRFAEATAENVGRPFAIVFDNRIVSAPVIRSPITGGTGTIEGGFTVEGAEEMATILRSGTLPVPLKVVERQRYETPPKID